MRFHYHESPALARTGGVNGKIQQKAQKFTLHDLNYHLFWQRFL